MLNRIWGGLVILALLSAWMKFLSGDIAILQTLTDQLFAMAKLGFEISLGLVGLMCLWLGLVEIAEKAGLIRLLARFLNPFFARIMPEVPASHPAFGHITMNLAANMLGLDNAATPLGIKAMHSLQTTNSEKDTASNAQILFLVLNTSSVTLFPMTVLLYLSERGAAEPGLLFLPILLATSASTLAGFLLTAFVQKLKIWQPIVLLYLFGFIGVIALIIAHFSSLDHGAMQTQATTFGNAALLLIVTGIVLVGFFRRVPVFDSFIEGAKSGFQIALQILPYLVAMLFAIGLCRGSGLLDFVLDGVRYVVTWLSIDPRFVDALPTGLMKPFSGSGARAMMLETIDQFGVESLPAKLSAIMQGSTETTLYVLAVYFGAVKIKHIRHALWCGLFADLVGIIAAICIGYWFFG